jgi:DNA-binding transcriptional LysR family regulator
MKMKQLETLVWIVRLGSFSAAADRLCTTQSTVSFRIQELEHDFDTALFDRTHRKVHLTAKGKELFLYAEQLIHLTSEMRHRIGNPAALSGLVRIGVAELIAITWMPKLVAALDAKHSGVTLEVDVDLTKPLVSRLRAGELDMLLVPGAVSDSNLVSQSIGKAEFCWMAGPQLKLPSGLLTPKDVETLPIISLSKESHHHTIIEQWFASANAYYSSVIRCNNLNLLASLTLAGRGIGYLPLVAFKTEIEKGRLIVLKTKPKMAPVEFFLAASNGHVQPLVDAVRAVVLEVSEFDRA